MAATLGLTGIVGLIGCETYQPICQPSQVTNVSKLPTLFTCESYTQKESFEDMNWSDFKNTSGCYFVGGKIFVVARWLENEQGKIGEMRIVNVNTGAEEMRTGQINIVRGSKMSGRGINLDLPGRYRVEKIVDKEYKGAYEFNVILKNEK